MANNMMYRSMEEADAEYRRYEAEFMRQRERLIREMDHPRMMWRGGFDWGFDAAESMPDLSKAPKLEPDRKAIPRFGVALAYESESENELSK